MAPSILDNVSVAKARPEHALAQLPRVFPRMDGARTWRLGGICGEGAVYPGGSPDTLVKMAGRKPGLAAVLGDGSFTGVVKSMEKAAAVFLMSKAYHHCMVSCMRKPYFVFSWAARQRPRCCLS